MSEQIFLTVDGSPTEVAAGTTGTDLFGSRRDVVVVRVDGELRDLHLEIPAGAVVEPVTIDSPEGLEVLRHS
ncbi:MAG: threonine--tRNA ligase, partial [Actinomycetota bacterium]|nr:threonine--tRNA ligase [Actinomycetota bacterium]